MLWGFVKFCNCHFPIDVQLNFSDGSTQTVHKSPAVWESNKKQGTTTVSAKKLLQPAKLGTDIYMDADEGNNSSDYK